MNNVLIFLLATASFGVALASGGIARLFRAKRPSMPLAVLVIALAAGVAIGVHYYWMSNSFIVLGTAFLAYMLLLSLLLGMKILDTLITSIAGAATMGLLLFAGGMAIEKYQKTPVLDMMLSYVEDNQSFISFDTFFPEVDYALAESNKNEMEDGFIPFTEQALVPEGARDKTHALTNKKYHEVTIADSYKLKGNIVRILKKNGDILQGTLNKTEANRLTLSIYIPESKGLITAPVPFSVISKLEVYR